MWDEQIDELKKIFMISEEVLSLATSNLVRIFGSTGIVVR